MKISKRKIQRLMFAVLVCVLLVNTLFVPGSIAGIETANRKIGLLIGCPDAIVNGVKTRIDPNDPNVVPIIQDGRTLIPLRFIAECFGVKVEWDEATSTVKVDLERARVEMVLGNTTVKYNVNTREMDVPAQVIDGRTMVSVRAFADLFDKYTFWDNRGLIIVSDLNDRDVTDEYIGRFLVHERVAQSDGPSMLPGFYGTTPESPDGKLVAYLVTENKPGSKEGKKGALYLCDSDLTNHRKIRDISNVNWHYGSHVVWLDNNTLAYNDNVDGKGLKTYIINTNGEEVAGPFQGNLGHGDNNVNSILMYVQRDAYKNGSDLGPPGIYLYNHRDGSVKQVLDVQRDFGPLKEKFPGSRDDIFTWEMGHVQLSPGGERILIWLGVGGGQDNVKILSCRVGGSEMKVFPTKPLHQQWYDDTTIFAHEVDWENGEYPMYKAKRWDLDGNYIETIAGVGNHMGISFDRKYYASETQYWTNPVVLRLYRYGNVEPLAILFAESPGTVWSVKTHIDPSFSRDSRKVYFNMPVAEDMIQMYRVDFSNLIRD
ncbi:MAG: hypothetical protein BWY15_00309 [Firmicutes bacterium ADurb.Bin193]|nr:MAG: hypothetical protein BWY15_00309 [Firmicutes bacterium ADurb.Bin193]